MRARLPFSRSSVSRQRPASAFTLVEVMVGTVLFLIAALGIFSGIIYAYRLAAETRYRDNARYILKSLGDEFLVQKSEDDLGGIKTMFAPTESATGLGLLWQGNEGEESGLTVTLGANTGAPIANALVTREVTYLELDGMPSMAPASSTGGILVRGNFQIAYSYANRNYSQQLSVVRRIP
jgi:Tfp pilus assembly protein PilV